MPRRARRWKRYSHQQAGLTAGTVADDDQLSAELGGHGCGWGVELCDAGVGGDLTRMLQQDGLRARRGIRRGSSVERSQGMREDGGRCLLGEPGCRAVVDATSAGGDGKGEKWRREQEVGSLQLMTEKRGWQPFSALAGTDRRGKGPGRRPEGGEWVPPRQNGAP